MSLAGFNTIKYDVLIIW